MDSTDTSTQPVEAGPTTTNVATFTPHRHSLPTNQNMAVNSQTFSGRPRTHNRRISDYSIHTQPPAAFANQRSALSPHQIRQPRLRMLPTQFEDTASQDPALPNTSLTGFRKVDDSTAQIPKRSTSPHHVTPLQALTLRISDTFSAINPAYNYNPGKNPRRVLTKPSKPAKNEGFDNEEHDYILYVNDILGAEEGQRYQILDILGAGTFGQVVKCQNLMTKQLVGVKVVKNKPAYLKQSLMEVDILKHLNTKSDPDDQHHLLRLYDTFFHKQHLCLVFELLSVNLYELIKQNQFKGLSTNLVKVFATQLLDALIILKENHIIHCDLKPENILLKNLESPAIKIIDFGSACHQSKQIYTYIQSRFYRSPEVLLGLQYTTAIDMWSFGCIIAELFLGLPLFPGSSEYNQVSRIVDTFGVPSNYMIEKGENARRFFERTGDTTGDPKKRFALKSRETYGREQKKTELAGKKYFHTTKLKDLIMEYALPRKGMSDQEKDREKQNRLALIDFLQGVLKLDPIVRWSPQQAKNHPFITGERFVGPYQPDSIRRMPVLPDTALATVENMVMPATSQGSILPTTQPVMSNSRLQDSFNSSSKLRPRSKTFSSSSSSASTSSPKHRTPTIGGVILEDVTPQAISTATDVERNVQWANDNGRDSIRYRNRHGDSFSGSTASLGQEGLKRRSTHGPSKSTAISDNNLKRSPSDVNRVKIDDTVRIQYGDDYRYENTDRITRRSHETDVESQTKAGRRNTGTYLAEEPQGLIPLPDRQRDLEEGNANMDESYQGKQGVSDNIGLHMVGGLLRRRASERL
ncbi:kinase-like domain-containing protein [Umbelopsis sp. AD052]|nr:kinase-like domain-containing protein [Umbelopsis sp. AD052]